MSLLRSSFIVSIYTLLSRILGVIRDVVIASMLGAGVLSDAFFVAFKIPNFLRRFFGEGAFNAAFVPLFAGELAENGREAARRLASDILSFLIMVLTIMSVLAILAMPWLMFVLAPGFSSYPEKFALTIDLTQITFCYIVFISVVTMLSGVLNSLDKFAAVAATPIILNLCLIAAPFALREIVPTPAHALAIGVCFAGIIQLCWLWYWCMKQQLMPRLHRPRLTPPVKQLLVLAAPAALGAGVMQLNILVDLILASMFDGAVSYLYYADRISQLPLALIGTAMGTAMLPMLSRQIREGKIDVAAHTQGRAVEFALLLALPATAGILTLAPLIISVIFEHGAFSAADTAQTYPALMAFACGIPAFVMVKIFTPAFYARRDTKTPFKIAVLCVGINVMLNLVLMQFWEHVGLALATSIASWVNSLLLYAALRRRGHYRLGTQLTLALKVVIASALMASCILAAQLVLPPLSETLRLVVLIMVGITAYAGAGRTLGIITKEQWRMLRR